MGIYKYCAESGKFILENLEIKVTPPCDLNDAFEMRPVVLNSDPQGWAKRFFDKILIDPAYFNHNRAAYANCNNFKEFQVFAQKHRNAVVASLVSASPKLDADLQKDVIEMVSNKWGVVSLCESPVEDLMWAHYADSHKGLVVEFDESDGLFTHPSFLNCEYSDTPSIYDPANGANHAAVEQFARQKRTAWRYEKESRLIVPLSECRLEPNKTPPLYLFKLEATIIVSVTFGLRTPDSLKQHVLQSLNRPDMRHITKWQIKATPGQDLKREPI